jgi:hypothetical protein
MRPSIFIALGLATSAQGATLGDLSGLNTGLAEAANSLVTLDFPAIALICFHSYVQY